ncbi:MAG: 2OG-Fe(II) oxygenase [Candidatus Binatia bacterium]
MRRSSTDDISARVGRVEWARVARQLDDGGWASLGPLLRASECAALRRGFDRAADFRSTVDMARHRFGRGVYRYFAYPLPAPVAALRGALYARLAPIANAWMARLGRAIVYPAALETYLGACHAAAQRRPTPLLLRYGAGDYNCLHQDLYGALAFPLQVVIPLSRQRDYDGGELIFAEQRPRSQSRATAVRPAAGEAIVFTNRERPVAGTRGDYRVQMRHGVSTITRGQRTALGVIFHDAT